MPRKANESPNPFEMDVKKKEGDRVCKDRLSIEGNKPKEKASPY